MPHRLLILSANALQYQEIIERAKLPDIEIQACTSLVQAALVSTNVEIVFGEPGLIRSLLPDLPNLAWVQATWAGVEPLLAAGLRHNYLLTNIRGVFGPLMSEYVFGYILFHERRILQRLASQKKQIWDNTPPRTMHNKTIGLLGVGSIGAHLAQTARHFGMKVRGFTRSSEDCEYVDKYYHPPKIIGFADGLDYLVAVLPNTPQTVKIVNHDVLAALDPTALFINVGRGSLVDEIALQRHLQANQIRAAILDVFQNEPLAEGHPFWGMPNVYITGHTAALSDPGETAEIFIKNYNRFIQNEPLENLVLFERGY